MRIVFMGTPDFAVSSLDAICQAGYDIAAVVTVPDRQTGRGLKITESPVKKYAREKGFEILQPEKLRDPIFLDRLQSFQADLFVVVAFRMLPKDVWAMPPCGTFNLHASLLPQYRGAAPINWAIINGETQTGITTFLLNERIDEGQILLQETTPITLQDNVESLHDRLASMGGALVVRTIQGLADGSLTPMPQTIQGVLKGAPKIFKDDCSINWNLDGIQVRNFVRGLSPYPAAVMTVLDGKGDRQTLKVFEVEEEKSVDSRIGEVVSDQKRILKIGVKDGFVRILSLQMNGKRRMSIEDFLRGCSTIGWKIVY